MNTRQHIRQRTVDDIVEAADDYRTKNRMMWDDPIVASGAAQAVLTEADWLYLRLKNIYPEPTHD